MDEPVTLLLLRHLFSEWAITRDREGTWRAAGRTLISSTDLDGLIENLVLADPGGARRAIRLLGERSSLAS